MEVFVNQTENGTLFCLNGRLDSVTAPVLEEQLKTQINSTRRLVFDFSNVAYLSSAGLRVLLGAQKKMKAMGGEMCIQNANSLVTDVFEVTGLADVFTFE